MVDDRVFLFADVAMLRLDGFPALRFVCVDVTRFEFSGGKTFGVVNTGFRRSVRMPVSSILHRRAGFAQRFARARRLLAFVFVLPDPDCIPEPRLCGNARDHCLKVGVTAPVGCN